MLAIKYFDATFVEILFIHGGFGELAQGVVKQFAYFVQGRSSLACCVARCCQSPSLEEEKRWTQKPN